MSKIEWQPIETVPRDGTKVLLVQDEWVEIGYWRADEWGEYETVSEKDGRRIQQWTTRTTGYWGGAEAIYEPTHWMPVPKPPTVSAQIEDK